jgi:hypothetical protein
VGSPHLRLGKFVFRHAKKLSRQHRPISEVRLSDLRKRCPPKNRKNAAIAESKKREADEKPTLIGGPVIAAQKTLGHTRLRRIRPTQIHSVPLLSSRPQLQILLHLARLWLISVCLPRVRLTLELGQLRQQVVEIFAPACRVRHRAASVLSPRIFSIPTLSVAADSFEVAASLAQLSVVVLEAIVVET